MILQLNPSIPVDTPKGKALAVAICDYSEHHHAIWVCLICSTGEFWWYPNTKVRAQQNISLGIRP